MRDVHIELASDISIFVGANNSGKTSATQIVQNFAGGAKDKISLFDFNSDAWIRFDQIGELPNEQLAANTLPTIALDLWFEVAAADLHLVLPLLPSNQWQGSEVGIRVEFSAKSDLDLVLRFKQVRQDALVKAALIEGDAQGYVPWPRTLSDFLLKELRNEFDFKYFVLDRAQFDGNYVQTAGYSPSEISGEPSGPKIIKSLIRVDSLGAQRHLADPTSSGVGGRAEDLSRRLSKFYQRNLKQRQDDHNVLKALFVSEDGFNVHLSKVFEPTLKRLQKLGYPGVNNPRLEIRSALNPASIMSTQDAQVHYLLGSEDSPVALPDTYNGLGFKNLIYMVVEILDAHARWISEEARPPLHLIFIEEPEAHLHTQLQQVFVRNVLELLAEEGGNEGAFQSQIVVTTHSPHILYERGFKPVRYFRREGSEESQSTQVLNLSKFYESIPSDRDFLERYLKLTHCDLFFADAAILVEGNVERLLLPIVIEHEVPRLRSACICILEVGGAYGHKFKSLIEFLGLPVLIITDLDSVAPTAADEAEDDDDETEFEIPAAEGEAGPQIKRGKACLPATPNAITSNQMLIQWLPNKRTIAELFAATEAERTQLPANSSAATVFVAYQKPIAVTFSGQTEQICGRTLEEAFGLQNPDWCQLQVNRPIGLRLRNAVNSPTELAAGLHKRVSGKAFDKTKFALALLAIEYGPWVAPQYITEGLLWLNDKVKIETHEEEQEVAPAVAPQ